MIQEVVIQVILPIIGTLTTVLLPILLAQALRWIKSKTDNENLQRAMGQLNDLVYTTVSEMEQTFQRAMADGRLTDDEKAEIKGVAMQKIQGQLPTYLNDQLKVGVNSLTDYISGKIEVMVLEMKGK